MGRIGTCQPWGSLLGSQAVSLRTLDAFLLCFEVIRFPREVFFFFFHSAVWKVKKTWLLMFSEIPVSRETWGIWTSKVIFNSFAFITVCLFKDHPPLPAQTSFCQDGEVQLSSSTERIWRFNCLTNPPLYLLFISREIRAASCLISLWRFCDTIWNTLTADGKFLSYLLSWLPFVQKLSAYIIQ